MNKPLMYDQRIANEFAYFAEMISNINNDYEGFKRSPFIGEELAIYWHDKELKLRATMGIWYECWKQYQVPISITIDYAGKAPAAFFDKIRDYVQKKGLTGTRFVDYEGMAVILLENEYFKYDGEDHVTLGSYFVKTIEFLETTLFKANPK